MNLISDKNDVISWKDPFCSISFPLIFLDNTT